MLVAESALNVACAGGRPAALVNCLNFGNPEHPEVMWQLSEAIDGMGAACRALHIPVVGGNVSFYNESRGRDIDPTPIVAVVGVIDVLEHRPPGVTLVAGHRLLLLGPAGAGLGGSRWAAQHGHGGGMLPPLDLDQHARVLDLVRTLVAEGRVGGVHDIADGGLALTLAELAIRTGVGVTVAGVGGHAELFSEAPSRVVVSVRPADVATITTAAEEAGVPWRSLGEAGGDRFVVDGLVDLGVAEMTERWRGTIPRALHPDS
jgi:phosphoribosylformylglycinamidine synthase